MTSHPIDESSSDELNDSSEEGGGHALRRANLIRFVKFGLVGGLGVFVNWLFFELGYYAFGFLPEEGAILSGYGLGLFVSIFTNFLLNDIWTWSDRVKGGRRDWLHRLVKYYVSASVAGVVQVVVSWFSLQWIWAPLGWRVPATSLLGLQIPAFGLGPRLGLLTGIAFGMVINFLASHLWAFEDAE